MSKIPKDEQDNFGHWLSNNGWMFDIDTDDIWLNVSKGTYSYTKNLYWDYKESIFKRKNSIVPSKASSL